MTRALLIAMLAARVAAAQPSPPTDIPLATYLEKRVPEELAVEGVMLSRDNLALKVEQLGDKLLVSLVDLATGRVAASTKIDQIPADREAAVASTTHVAADLVAQVVSHGATPAPTPPPPVDTHERELSDLRLKRESIRFGATYALTVNNNVASLSRHWQIYRGDLDQELDPDEFYRLVGRPELIEEYHQRRNTMIGAFVVTGLGIAGAVISGVKIATHDDRDCGSAFDPNFSTCVQNDVNAGKQAFSTYMPLIFAFGGAAILSGWIGVYYGRNLHPISENEAKTLADEYNQGLRRNLGLPTVRREQHHLRLTPYMAGRDGGLVVGGTF